VGFAIGPTVVDFVVHWRSTALEESYEEFEDVMKEVARRTPEKDLSLLSQRTKRLYELLQKTTPYNSRLEQQDTLVPDIYKAYVEAFELVRAGNFPASHRELLTMHIDLMVAECLFLN
jgi:hypothetical protein